MALPEDDPTLQLFAADRVAGVTRWACDVCGQMGQVVAAQGTGYGELLRRVEHAHRAAAGGCRGRLVRHDQALYPVRLRDPMG